MNTQKIMLLVTIIGAVTILVYAVRLALALVRWMRSLWGVLYRVQVARRMERYI